MKNSVINWFLNIFKPQKEEVFPGAILEENVGSLKNERDVLFQDIVSAPAPVDWQPLDLNNLPNWPVLNQDRASSCVAFTMALMATIVFFLRSDVMIVFSGKWLYNWRRNKPGLGMISDDIFNIASTKGMIPEELMPSQNQSEAEINTFDPKPWHLEVGKALKISPRRVIVPVKDIETVASIMQVTKKPIMVWFNFAGIEWQDIPYVSGYDAPNRHSVTFIPPMLKDQRTVGIINGKKAIVIQDSWGLKATSLNGKRVITEDFYKSRNLFAAYFMNFYFDEGKGDRPWYDGTVVSLQKCLQFEGCFPLNVTPVENYGPTTTESVRKFQVKYNLPQDGKLNSATLIKIKELYK